MDRAKELEALQRLNITMIAADFGYRIVRKKSSRHSVVMAHSNGDRIICARNGKSGHYVYKSVFDHRSKGTIVQLVQNSLSPGSSLGQVRKLIRPYLGYGGKGFHAKKSAPEFYVSSIEPSITDIPAVQTRYVDFLPDGFQDYLCNERNIPPSLLTHRRLQGLIKFDPQYRSVIFPHFAKEKGKAQFTGYEYRNIQNGNSGFASGGAKGLWLSRGYPTDRSIAFCEAGIDSVSYLALGDPEFMRVGSFGGSLSEAQPELITAALLRMPLGSQAIAAVDHDHAGFRFAELLEEIFSKAGRSDLTFRIHVPETAGLDWNDCLKLDNPKLDLRY